MRLIVLCTLVAFLWAQPLDAAPRYRRPCQHRSIDRSLITKAKQAFKASKTQHSWTKARRRQSWARKPNQPARKQSRSPEQRKPAAADHEKGKSDAKEAKPKTSDDDGEEMKSGFGPQGGTRVPWGVNAGRQQLQARMRHQAAHVAKLRGRQLLGYHHQQSDAGQLANMAVGLGGAPSGNNMPRGFHLKRTPSGVKMVKDAPLRVRITPSGVQIVPDDP